MRYDETVNVILHHSAVLFRKTIKNEVKNSLHRHFKREKEREGGGGVVFIYP